MFHTSICYYMEIVIIIRMPNIMYQNMWKTEENAMESCMYRCTVIADEKLFLGICLDISFPRQNVYKIK